MLVTEAIEESQTKTQKHSLEAMTSGAGDLLSHPAEFPRRHIGPSAEETRGMLELLGQPSLEALIDKPFLLAFGSPGRFRYPLAAANSRYWQD